MSGAAIESRAASVISAIAGNDALALDERIRELTTHLRCAAVELGGLLLRMKREKLFTRLGFESFGDYVKSHGFSQGYGDRIMRAHRIVVEHPELHDLDVNRILFVDNASKRGTGLPAKHWIGFAREHTQSDLRNELKRLTRAGSLPSGDGRGRAQAIRNADVDVALDLKIRVPALTYKLFHEQCRLWGKDMATTLLKLLVVAGDGDKEE